MKTPRDLLEAARGRAQKWRRQWEESDRRGRRRLALLAILLLLLLCVGCLWIYYLSTRKPLPALLPAAPALAQARSPHFLFSIYGVQTPLGVAVTPEGDRIYVTESGGKRLIKVFDRDGKFLFSFAPPGSTALERAPVYIALAPDGRVFVSDRLDHAIHIYDAGGNYLGDVAAPGGETLWAPLGVGFAGDELYVTEVVKHQVFVFDATGTLKLTFGEEGDRPGQFRFPNGIAVDDEGRIYVADGNNGRLQVFDERGRFLYLLGAMSLPRGVRMDGEDRLYVVDAVAQTVRTFDVRGQRLESLFDFGNFGLGDGEFNFPNDIAADETGRLYITDRENHRVQVWSY